MTDPFRRPYPPPPKSLVSPVGNLRDHFAGLAMQAMVAHDGHLSGDDKLAAIAYRVADAMLKQRDL